MPAAPFARRHVSAHRLQTSSSIGVLGFLGIGLPPPDPDWGGMVKDTYGMMSVWPHMALVPCRGDLVARHRASTCLAVGPPGARTPVTEGPLLEFRDVAIAYATRGGEVPVIPALSFRMDAGEAMGLVGESGLRQVHRRAPLDRAVPGAGRAASCAAASSSRGANPLAHARRCRAARGARAAHRDGLPGPHGEPQSGDGRFGRQLMEVPMIHEGVGGRGRARPGDRDAARGEAGRPGPRS